MPPRSHSKISYSGVQIVVAVRRPGRRVLADPLVEVARADRQAVVRHEGGDAHRRLAAVAEPVKADPGGVDERQRLEPVGELLVLRDDHREERLLERVRLALEGPEAVAEDVEVLGREGDEPAAGEGRGEVVVRLVVDLRVGHVLRSAFEAVLADDDRPPLALLDPLRHEQDAVGDHVREDVEDDLVAEELRVVVDLAGARVGGQERVIEAADDVVAEGGPVGLDGPVEGVERRRVELAEVGLPGSRALGQELLVVAVDLVDLPELAGVGVEAVAELLSARPARSGGDRRGRGRAEFSQGPSRRLRAGTGPGRPPLADDEVDGGVRLETVESGPSGSGPSPRRGRPPWRRAS